MAGVRWGISAYGVRKASAKMAPEVGTTENGLMAMFGRASPKRTALYTENVCCQRLASRSANLFADEMKTSALKV